MKRPTLRSVSLSDVLPLGERSRLVVTMTLGQWDELLRQAYNDGWVLLELDDDEQPVAAYRKAGTGAASS